MNVIICNYFIFLLNLGHAILIPAWPFFLPGAVSRDTATRNVCNTECSYPIFSNKFGPCHSTGASTHRHHRNPR